MANERFEKLWDLKKNQFEVICKDAAVVSVFKSFAKLCFQQGHDLGLEVAIEQVHEHASKMRLIDYRMKAGPEMIKDVHS